MEDCSSHEKQDGVISQTDELYEKCNKLTSEEPERAGHQAQ